MKNMTKKIAAAITTVAMTLSMAVSAGAYHINPNNGMPCNSSYYYLTHHSLVGTSTGSHGAVCTVTYYTYRHLKYCTCGYAYGEGPGYQCTDIHTCGQNRYDCQVPF